MPHLLSDKQKQERVRQVKLLLQKLMAQQHRVWHNIVILDKLWFDLTTEHEFIWLTDTEKHSWKGEIDDSVKKTDTYNYLESTRVSRNKWSS
jgi:hypothetical protein